MTLTTSNTKLILMPVYGLKLAESGKLNVSLSAVINYGLQEGNELRFETKDGVKTKSIDSFDSCFAIVGLDEVDLDCFMWKWNRINKNDLPFVVDESIDTHETYKDDFSPLTLMIERRAKEIAIKPIFKSC